jgi:hypothetical protein
LRAADRIATRPSHLADGSAHRGQRS